MWTVGTGIILWFTRRLSDVWLEGPELLVVRGSVQERIRLTDIRDVSESRYWNPKHIRLRLRGGAASQEQVIFLAPVGFQMPFSDHRVVRDLRAEVARARSAAPLK
jgi:hypothetical protein